MYTVIIIFMSKTEFNLGGPYPYIDFVKSLSEKDGIVAQLTNIFLDCVQNDEIRILSNSHVLTSRLSPYDLGVTIFLPEEYDDNTAILEAPRIIVDTLRTINKLPQIKDIEDQFRRGLL